MTLGFKNWFLRAFAILLWVALSACQKTGQVADADIIGGTDEVLARLKLAQSQAQQALENLSTVPDSKLCSPQACAAESGVCDYLNPLSSPSRREFVRESLRTNSKLFIDFIAEANFEIIEDLKVDGHPADARISSEGRVEFDREASKGKTLEILIQRWIHEAGHGIALAGLPNPIRDNTSLPESLLGFEFLDALGSCVAASISYPEDELASIAFVNQFTSAQAQAGVEIDILKSYFKGRYGESARITGARIRTDFLQAVGAYQLSVTPSQDPVWNTTSLAGNRILWLNGSSAVSGQFSTQNNKYLMVEFAGEHVGLYKQLGNASQQEILAGENLMLNVPKFPLHVFNDPEASIFEAFRSMGNFEVNVASDGKTIHFEAAGPSLSAVVLELEIDIHVELSEYPNRLNQTDFQEPLRLEVAP